MRHPRDWGLYLVTDRRLACARPISDVVEAAVRGGVGAVQLREKDCCTREFVELGRNLKRLLGPLEIPLIINDRVDVALAIGADGVHIGQQDMEFDIARRLLGDNAIIGISIETVAQARVAESIDADYLGVGPIFPTETKADAATALGLDGLAELRSVSRHVLVAIGGIGLASVDSVVKAGADAVAVVSAICAAEDPEKAARELRQAMSRTGAGPRARSHAETAHCSRGGCAGEGPARVL